MNLTERGSPPGSKGPMNGGRRRGDAIRLWITVLGLLYVALCLIIPETRRLGWIEVSLLIAILLLNSDWEKMTLSKDAVSIERRFVKVEQEQLGQKKHNEILIKFVIDMLVTTKEVSLLQKLAADNLAEYKNDETQQAYLQYELRRLRALYLIEESKTSGRRVKVSELPMQGDLKGFFEITSRGREFLKLRDQLKEILKSEG